MKYISIKECLNKIEEKKINRKRHANVYVAATDQEMVLQFAYSEDKLDHFILAFADLPQNKKDQEELWGELLSASMIIEHTYRVKRIVDDVRTRGEQIRKEVV